MKNTTNTQFFMENSNIFVCAVNLLLYIYTHKHIYILTTYYIKYYTYVFNFVFTNVLNPRRNILDNTFSLNNFNLMMFVIPEISIKWKSSSFDNRGKSFPVNPFFKIMSQNIFNSRVSFIHLDNSSVDHWYSEEIKYYISKLDIS